MIITLKHGTQIDVPLTDANLTGYNAQRVELVEEDLATLNSWLNSGNFINRMGQLSARIHRVQNSPLGIPVTMRDLCKEYLTSDDSLGCFLEKLKSRISNNETRA